MKKVYITYGQDTPAYANSILDVPDAATDEEIIAAAKSVEIGDLVFDPSYDWAGARIVELSEVATGRVVATDIPLEISGEDLGLIAQMVLSGQVKPKALLDEAERQGLSVSPEVAEFLRHWPDTAQSGV